jgi:hypothetical protein
VDVSKAKWEPNPVRAYGIAYGFDDMEYARKTAPDAIRQLKLHEVESRQAVSEFIAEVRKYFHL